MAKALLLFVTLIASLSASCAWSADVTPDYRLGVYYFPGWLDGQRGAPAAKPWERIKEYPEREPLLGWYREGDATIMEQQINWMSQYGIDYVVFDWFWDGKPFLEHGISAFFRAENNKLVDFAVLWANHSNFPKSADQFLAMVGYWVKYYFPKENYLKIDGKPVVFLFSMQRFRDDAKAFGGNVKELIARANDLAIRAGLKGIYFVGAAEAVAYWVKDYGPKNGYSAYSTYNYHRGFSGLYLPHKLPAHSYAELDSAYQESWDWILNNSPLPYILPMTSGWDKRPWGGSLDPLHDRSFSTPDEFERHLRAAKSRIDRFKDKTMSMGVICCWNEFGEGSYIEPTKQQGFEYLSRVRKVFGNKAEE